jgi:hypothetical protein
MRYVWKLGADTMHIQRFTTYGEPLNKGLCGRKNLNRSINSPWKLGKELCGLCERIYNFARNKAALD